MAASLTTLEWHSPMIQEKKSKILNFQKIIVHTMKQVLPRFCKPHKPSTAVIALVDDCFLNENKPPFDDSKI